MRPFLIGSVALLGACGTSQRVDLCRRGDRVEVVTFRLSALDVEGALLEQWSVSADRPTTSDGLLPTGTRRVRAEGLDGSSVVVAVGESTVVDPDSVCVCVAASAQHPIACAAVACRVSNDTCAFTDESGAPLGPRTFSFGDNSDDDIQQVTADTFLNASAARVTHNFGGEPILQVGSDPTAPRVGLWSFDLRAVPSTAQITSATFGVTTMDNPTDAPLDLFAVLEAWDAGTKQDTIGCSNWTCRTDGTSPQDWSVVGAGPPTSSAATALLTLFPALPNTRYEGTSSGLADLVQQWVASPADNHGLTARIPSTSNASLGLSAVEGPDGTRPTLRVELEIPADPQ